MTILETIHYERDAETAKLSGQTYRSEPSSSLSANAFHQQHEATQAPEAMLRQ